jgi:hypothetical protein
LDEIDRLADQFGRPPSSGGMNRIGKFHKCTYLNGLVGGKRRSPKLASRNRSPTKSARRFRTAQTGQNIPCFAAD